MVNYEVSATTTIRGTSTTSSPPVMLQVTMPTTTSATASVASPAQIAFPIQGIHPPSHLNVKENVAENWKIFKHGGITQYPPAYGNITNIHQQPETLSSLSFSSQYRA